MKASVNYILNLFVLSLLVGCAPKSNEVLFSLGERFPTHVEIFHPEKDTILVVMGRPTGTKYYSYHVTKQTDTALILENTLQLKPFATLLKSEKDSLLRFTFIDDENQIITKTNPFILINDSVKCMYQSYATTLKLFHTIDSIYSLKIYFGEGFNFQIENLSVGHITIQLHNYKESDSRSDRAIMYHEDYYIKTNQKILLSDSSTLNRNLKLYSFDNIFEYQGVIELSKKEYKRIFDWNNVPIK